MHRWVLVRNPQYNAVAEALLATLSSVAAAWVCCRTISVTHGELPNSAIGLCPAVLASKQSANTAMTNIGHDCFLAVSLDFSWAF
jgi:hypothetical protein